MKCYCFVILNLSAPALMHSQFLSMELLILLPSSRDGYGQMFPGLVNHWYNGRLFGGVWGWGLGAVIL